MKVSIVIPVYNERMTVKTLVSRVCALDLDKEILIVDDGSTDGSREILESEIAGLPCVRVLYQPSNQGKGAALRRGFEAAQGEVVIVQDADLELDPKNILSVVQPILEGKATVVYGSRFKSPGPRAHSLSYWANQFLTVLTNLLYGATLTDMETCYKCFHAPVLRKLTIDSNRFDVEPELTAKILRLGYAVAEVPVAYVPRSTHQGKKIGMRDGLKAIWTLVKYRLLPLSRIQAPPP